MIKLLAFVAAVFFISSAVSVGGFSQINLESFGQSNITSETKRESQNSNQVDSDMATINVTKTVRCDSSLGIPSDDSVCQFVLTNVESGQFSLGVSGNTSDSTSFRGSSNGTIISVSPGNYTVTENQYDTMDLENQLGENAIVSVITETNGDCIGQFNQVDSFQEATGIVEAGQNHSCEIINTLSVNQGSSPEEP
ncbi:MAG TPA: hypothetical protein VJR94_02750 [Candidatus Nitrosocosmicus sp.]|nr:hypothetical protein [Candidatus Nitrosocosmicus sp.]